MTWVEGPTPPGIRDAACWNPHNAEAEAGDWGFRVYLVNLKILPLQTKSQTRVIAKWLRVLTVLANDLVRVPAPAWCLTTTTSFPPGAPVHVQCTQTYVRTHIHRNNKLLLKKDQHVTDD